MAPSPIKEKPLIPRRKFQAIFNRSHAKIRNLEVKGIMGTSMLKKRILADLENLTQPKIAEVADFIEYLKVRQSNWRERFKSFLKKTEPKMARVSYSDIRKEITKARNK